MQYNKAIVGRNAFAHESGIHQDGVLKDASTYEIMRPEMIGLKKSSLVLGKHSGRHAFVHKLEEMGYKLGANQLEDAFVRMKALADRKKDIYDEDIEALVDQEIAASHDRIKLTSLTVIAGTHGPQRATMKLDVDGQIRIEEAEGNGPVDAVFNCIKALVPHEAKLELYQVHAVTEGTDAQAEVSVRLAHEGRSMTSKASDPDTLVASAKAYLGALNKIVMKHQRDTTAAGGGLIALAASLRAIGSRECATRSSSRAKRSNPSLNAGKEWIASAFARRATADKSSLSLLAMLGQNSFFRLSVRIISQPGAQFHFDLRFIVPSIRVTSSITGRRPCRSRTPISTYHVSAAQIPPKAR